MVRTASTVHRPTLREAAIESSSRMTQNRLPGRFAPTTPGRSVPGMRRWFYILLIAISLLVLALLGWTVQGIRTVVRSRRPTLASVTG